MKRVGFCFLSHYAHVRHQLPIALKLAEDMDYSVDLLVTTTKVYEEILRIAPNIEQSKCTVKMLSGTPVKTFIGKLKKRSYPNIKNIVKANKSLFLSYDALVTPHSNLNDVMALDKARNIKYVCTFHGAGDGCIGFDKKFGEYDLLLAPGIEVANRLNVEGIHHENNHLEVIGYVKFDTLSSTNETLFHNSNTTVLYNPHYDKQLTSWNRWGVDVLDYFAAHKNYNLIFAPHLKLFERGVPDFIQEYDRYPNIHIDCQSYRLADCTYTKQADVYLGDVSSQVYEFLFFNEAPAIFLNAQNCEDWCSDPNYAMWHLGCVINDVSELNDCLQGQLRDPQSKSGQQAQAVHGKFFKSDEGPAQRGAEAIKRLTASKS